MAVPQHPADNVEHAVFQLTQVMADATNRTQSQISDIAHLLGAATFQSFQGNQQFQNVVAQGLHAAAGQGSSRGYESGYNASGATGFRGLKPKKDLPSVTADSAETLMYELDQFEVDCGEIGVVLRSEAGYRQLRAQSSGKARDVLDLDMVYGIGEQLCLELLLTVFSGKLLSLLEEG